eukprot:TRINITY_DN4003_c0_g1_i1.p1 TRINITY_DN4003_c0_g1~~TRINITY_DN4003_c0_g1_i1.p1  ORF type:complete len:482 (-),score=109.79 TRINITY_DN4003_c0_g1_i1:342-1661(-)
MDRDGSIDGDGAGGGSGSENGVDGHSLGYLLDGADGDGELAAASVLRPEILDAVVKVYATHSEPNYSQPWQQRRQVQSTSSGFIIEGRRLLTNAHSVEHYTVVQVKKRGSDVKYQCRVLAIAHECDLALMAVDDDAFWADTQPLRPGGLPMLQDAIVVIGYPIGGSTVSVTAGVVSRVEMMPYSHGQAELLGVQVDSAINPGNSGGPAFNSERQVVGVAFQGLAPTEAEAIGYIIPFVVVQHFLDDVARHEGRYTGFCSTGFEWSKLENKDMRASLGLTTPDLGVLVKHVDKPTPAAEQLSKGDVVTHIDRGAHLLGRHRAVPVGRAHLFYLPLHEEVCRRHCHAHDCAQGHRHGRVVPARQGLRPAARARPREPPAARVSRPRRPGVCGADGEVPLLRVWEPVGRQSPGAAARAVDAHPQEVCRRAGGPPLIRAQRVD